MSLSEKLFLKDLKPKDGLVVHCPWWLKKRPAVSLLEHTCVTIMSVITGGRLKKVGKNCTVSFRSQKIKSSFTNN